MASDEHPLLAAFRLLQRQGRSRQRCCIQALSSEKMQLMVRGRNILESCNQQLKSGGKGLFSRASGLDSSRPLQLSGSISLGPASVLETFVQATNLQLMEIRVRLMHMRLADFTPHNGRIALTGGTDLQSRHRLTLESMIGSEEERHSLSGVVSADSSSSTLAWGVGTSHRLKEELTAFSRFSSDRRGGERFILQAVHKVGKHTVSPICSVASKGSVQAGITWKSFLQGEGEQDYLQVRALWSQNGTYSIHLKAQFGEIQEATL